MRWDLNAENWKFYQWIYNLYENEEEQDFEKFQILFTKQEKENKIYLTKKQKKDLANLMIERFGKEESIRRINSILDISNNKNLHNLLSDVKKAIEENN